VRRDTAVVGVFVATAAWGPWRFTTLIWAAVRSGIALAGSFALLSLAVLVVLFSRRWRWRAIAGYALAFACLITWWSGIAPSNDRQWKPEVARLPL
jgi:hypothetical protein